MLILFYISHHDGEIDHNFDLFVWAETPDEAVDYWRNYYGTTDDDMPHDDLPPVPDGIFPVPTRAPVKGALSWHRDVRQVQAPVAIAKEAFKLRSAH